MNHNKIDLIFATGNQNKVEEMSHILDQDKLDIKSLKDIGYTQDIAETGLTLKANAIIKAKTIHEYAGKNVFSEDTGLEVISLGMAPGVHTARYSGERSPTKNMEKLLNSLTSVDGDPVVKRMARFRTVICLIWEGKDYTFEGLVNGSIANTPSGEGGFGYDPVFIPYGFDESFAVLDPIIKNSLSHRFRAAMGMKKFLESI